MSSVTNRRSLKQRKEDAMALCNHCKRKFQSSQAVKAHLKHCLQYQNSDGKNSSALGSEPKAEPAPVAPPPFQSGPQVAKPDLSDPWRELMKSMSEPWEKPDAPRSPQQQRRQVLQAAKEQVIDQFWTPSCSVTIAMRGVAKATIERELNTLSLEELPFKEVCEYAVAIRDRIYAPALKEEAQEATRQQVEEDTRRKLNTEAQLAESQAQRRKTILMNGAIARARAICEAKGFMACARVSLLADIETQLDEFLTGREPVADARAIIQSALDARFAEADAKQEAVRMHEARKWRDEITALVLLGTFAGLVVLAFKYPTYTIQILNWIERTFGITTRADTGSPNREASEATESAASDDSPPHSRRRRKGRVSPLSPEPLRRDAVGPARGHA
jgi:hypothetical protein